MIALFVLAVILFVLWLAAVLTHLVLGAAIHILLGAAVVVFIVGILMRVRRPA